MGEKKVRDHDHATGEYRGAAHNFCNLQFRRQKVIAVFFHNLRGYDAHFIMRGIHKHVNKRKRKGLQVIPTNTEKYISFSLSHLRFLDSNQFMPFPLEKLADNLATYPILEELFPEVWGVKDVNLLKKKGVYPYDYMDSFERFQEDALPPKEAFRSLLTEALKMRIMCMRRTSGGRWDVKPFEITMMSIYLRI